MPTPGNYHIFEWMPANPPPKSRTLSIAFEKFEDINAGSVTPSGAHSKMRHRNSGMEYLDSQKIFGNSINRLTLSELKLYSR